LEIELRPQSIAASNGLEYAISLSSNSERASALRQRGQPLRRVGRSVFRRRAMKSLIAASKGPLHLSTDTAIERAHARMVGQLDRLRRDFA
jgi:hypothetical protein